MNNNNKIFKTMIKIKILWRMVLQMSNINNNNKIFKNLTILIVINKV